MRQLAKRTAATIGVMLMFALPLPPAFGAVDLGNGVCDQNGELGVWDGTTADDSGCVTPTEYEARYRTPEVPEPLETVLATFKGDDGPTVREWFDEALDQRVGPR